jgi:hypothetical protein
MKRTGRREWLMTVAAVVAAGARRAAAHHARRPREAQALHYRAGIDVVRLSVTARDATDRIIS